MIQSLHIFRKDIRHLWPELTLYIVLLTAFGLVTPQLREGARFFGTMLGLFANLLNVLLPVVMFLLIIRAIQDESLVGDQQFWVTRPYAWTSLLGAKLLFIVVCIILPFAAMQCSLLLQAGLNPLASIPGLLLTLLYFVVIVWLTMTVVAAVTSTLARAFLSLVAALVIWAGFLTLISSFGDGIRTTPPIGFTTGAILLGGLVTGILLYQYASRNTSRSRIALLTTAALFLVLMCCVFRQYPAGVMSALIRHHYPASTNAAEHLNFDSSPGAYQDSLGRVRAHSGFFSVILPVHLEGLDPSARIHEANLSFTVDAPGYHYTSPWQPVTVAERGLPVPIPEDIFNRIHATSARIHLNVAAQRLLPDAPQTVTVTDNFNVPGGRCIMLANRPSGSLVCRYAFQGPPPTRINGSVTAQSCDAAGPPRPGVTITSSRTAGTIPDPIIQEPLDLGGNVCPGTQLTFLPYHPAGDFRLELDIPSITLDHYVAHGG